jgi:anti-anti-sigma factor
VSAEGFWAKVVGLDDDTVVFLSGELDMATAPELTGLLGTLVAQGPPEVVLDFSGLSFIDSSGIAALVDSQHRLNEQKRRLCIQGAQREAVRVFEIAGLVEFLHVQTDRVEDRAQLREQAGSPPVAG